MNRFCAISLVILFTRFCGATEPSEDFGYFFSAADVAIHINSTTNEGNASYSLLDIPYALDLEFMSEDSRYSFWKEPRYPGFYWAIAKTKTRICDTFTNTLLERYDIWYVNQRSGRVYMHFYASRRTMRGNPSTGAGTRDR